MVHILFNIKIRNTERHRAKAFPFLLTNSCLCSVAARRAKHYLKSKVKAFIARITLHSAQSVSLFSEKLLQNTCTAAATAFPARASFLLLSVMI